MPLAIGIRLGPYEVTAQIGAGGMGEVNRARDTTLGRDVAIKVLPDAFVHDAERLARFEREAKTLASLNHSKSRRSMVSKRVRRFAQSSWSWLTGNTGRSHRARVDSHRLMAVGLTGTQPGGEFRAGATRELFSGLLNLPPHKYDLTPDGQRFLVLTTRTLEAGPAPIVVVVNWQEELKQRLPAN